MSLAEEPMAEEVPGPTHRPARSARSWLRSIAGWLVVTLIAAGLAGGAIASARMSGIGQLDRLAPDGAGITWVYREVTNGTPTGTATVRSVATALSLAGQNQEIAVHVDNYLGRGQPHDEIHYQAKQGNRLVQLGTRQSGTFSQLTPPQTLLDLPATPGHRFTWRGKRANPAADISDTTQVVGIDTLMIAGQRLTGCPHLHDVSTESSSGQPAFPTTVDRWLCPGVGEVRIRTDAPTANIHLDEELLSVHGPGVDLGPATPASPAAAPSGAAAPSQSPAIDISRLAWSDTRARALQFPPVGRHGLIVVEEVPGVLGGRVAAFDQFGGKVNWEVQIAVPAPAPPAVAESAVLVPDAAKHLLALDPATGATRWSASFDDVVSEQPAVVGEQVIVATEDGALHAVALADGQSGWVSPLSAKPSGLTVLGPDVIVATSNGAVSAVSAATGKVRWTNGLQGATSAGPAAGPGVVVAADEQGQLSAFDADTGAIRWTDYLRTTLRVPMTMAGSTVLAADGSRVRAFDLGDGHERWSADLGGTATTPAAVGGTVFVSTRDNLVQLALSDGRRQAALPLPRPEGVRPRATLPPTVVAGQLVVTLTLDPYSAWPHTTMLAFPDRSDTGPSGVRFGGDFRPVPAPPTRAPVLRGSDLLLVGANGVVDAPANGPPRNVLVAKGNGFLVSAGNMVLARDGADLVALGASGRLWSFPMGNTTLTDVPAVSATSVLVPVRGEGLAALAPDTGRLQWLFRVTGQGGSTPLVLSGGDVVYALGGLTRLGGATGSVRWQIPGFNAFGPISEGDGVVFASGFLNNDQVLLAVDETTGAIRWQMAVPVSFLSGPAVAGTAVAVTAGDSVVRVFDAGSGRLLWMLPLPTSASGSPVIVAGRLVIAEEGRPEDNAQLDHRVTVYDLASGRFLGGFAPSGSSFGIDSFGASDGRLLFPTIDSRGINGVYILGLEGP